MATQKSDAPTGFSQLIRTEVLASLVVFMVALPLCIAIAIACDLPPEVGIITGIIGGIVVGPLAGSPLQVSGPAAGLIVLVLDFVKSRQKLIADDPNALPVAVALGAAVLLAGLMQIGMAAAKLGNWFRAVAPSVILGMLGGIGVVIFIKQVHVMADVKAANKVVDNFKDVPSTIMKVVSPQPGAAGEHTKAAIAGLITLAIIVGWKKLPKKVQLVPGALVGVIVGTLVAESAGWNIERIKLAGKLQDSISWLSLDYLKVALQEAAIWKMAVVIALIASAETLLCAVAVDKMHSGPRTKFDRELAAQGVGNGLCGIMGCLPMTGVIVRSSANVTAGSTTRISATLHGVWLLVMVVALPFVIGMMPTACLAAVLVFTGFKLVDWRSGLKIYRESKAEGWIFVATLVGVVVFDLLTGVLIGIGFSVIRLIKRTSYFEVREVRNEEKRRIDLFLDGSATFITLPKFAKALESIPRGWNVHIQVDGLAMLDHACLQLLMDWEKQYEAGGGTMVVDKDNLRIMMQQPHGVRPGGTNPYGVPT